MWDFKGIALSINAIWVIIYIETMLRNSKIKNDLQANRLKNRNLKIENANLKTENEKLKSQLKRQHFVNNSNR